MARYVVETDRGHYITYDEVLEILHKGEENGFVHEITNIDGEEKIIAICNCNVNVCNALRTSQLFNTPNLSRSAYVAKVESENCVACGRCVETCPAGAVKLGQKLCTKDGPIEYPRHELPDETAWGPDKWDIYYRDNNRINCYDTGTSPCKTACPAHIAVQGYLKLAAQGKYREALQLIKRENPFPAVCGRICNRRCEDACTRGTVDQAVAIDEVKRFIAQQDLEAATRFIPRKGHPSRADSMRRSPSSARGRRACPAHTSSPKGLPPDRVRKQISPSRRHADERHSELPSRKGRCGGRDRHSARDGRGIPLRRGCRQGRHHPRAARTGLQGVLCCRRSARTADVSAFPATTPRALCPAWTLQRRSTLRPKRSSPARSL